jgi:hypothetical protein
MELSAIILWTKVIHATKLGKQYRFLGAEIIEILERR